MKNIIIYALLFGFISIILEYGFYRFSPTEDFLEMQSVQPVREIFNHGETPYFTTYAHYKVPGKITRKDIQYCKEPNQEEYSYYSLYESSIYKEKEDIVIGKSWRYNIEGPTIDLDCYLYTITSIELQYGIKKYDTYISNEYKYREFTF